MRENLEETVNEIDLVSVFGKKKLLARLLAKLSRFVTLPKFNVRLCLIPLLMYGTVNAIILFEAFESSLSLQLNYLLNQALSFHCSSQLIEDLLQERAFQGQE
ncbi:MAG: hypothetical protein Ct9H90mP7_4140 [Candidatus Neomarinimicrobiota bacterium]|nr:MAG: hypothetical protein Ct9H90mP7_4140 [Candidatus Neomarinimicrobiota bacterium]